MAKQTFTTGQVLTAAQMTSLQQTAMLGGSATAKTASYVLVAADAGTTVAMSAAGATTITVNTGLFAAGDTVFIQNRGAGACTVTAGTATVATAGSLILPQNDAGILYFTATGAATFYDFIQAGAVSPLTTKGDLYTFSTSDARLGVGTNTHVLTADSAEATGLKWAAPAGGGGMTLLSTTTLSGTSTTISSISQNYTNLFMVLSNISTTGVDAIKIRPNNDTGTNYTWSYVATANTTLSTEYNGGTTYGFFGVTPITSTLRYRANGTGFIPRYTSTETKIIQSTSVIDLAGASTRVYTGQINHDLNTAITSITFVTDTISSGIIYLYGVN
jgi:hypothetical protein